VRRGDISISLSFVLAISIITLCECILGACKSIVSEINRGVVCENSTLPVEFYFIALSERDTEVKHRKIAIISIILTCKTSIRNSSNYTNSYLKD